LKEKLQLSGWLQAWLDEHKKNALWLSKAIGLSHVTIGNYLKGKSARSDHVVKLAQFFKVSADELLGIKPPQANYGEHQPQIMTMHDAPTKKVIAKLRGQVQNLQSQIIEINSTLNELES
jgi:transcriptional regulator with XRE-family HTH domain